MSERVFEILGKRLRDERLKHRLTKAQLARMSGIAETRLHNIENGYERIRGSELFDLAECLEVPYNHMFVDLGDHSISREPNPSSKHRLVTRILSDLRVQRLIKRLAALKQWS